MLRRLETMVLMTGYELPLRAIREQIASAVDVIVHTARLRDGSRKIVSITEVYGVEDDDILTQEIFRFERVLIGQRELRRALTDRAAPPESRAALVASLLQGKAEPATVQLVSQAAFGPRGRTMAAMLGRMVRLSAQRRQLLVAAVTAATPLSSAQLERLSATLERAYGRAVQISVAVDPRVIGGMKVQVGEHVVDSTTLGRLEDVRRRLAG